MADRTFLPRPPARAARLLTSVGLMLSLLACNSIKDIENKIRHSVDVSTPETSSGGEGGAAPETATNDPETTSAPEVVETANAVEAAPRTAAASALPPPPAAVRSLTLDIATPADVRIYFLQRDEEEVRNSVFYGYMLIGAGVSAERKAAIARGLACRIDAAPSREAAEQIDLLALVSIPATRPAGAQVVKPDELLDAYDFPRANRWLEVAGDLVNEEFSDTKAVVFVGSRISRIDDFAAGRLQQPIGSSDPIIADASNLSPRYLERWAFEIIKSVKSGQLKGKQDMQRLMEIHSWIENVGTPFATFFKLVETASADEILAAGCR
ncbi:MAG: hypothetical protein KTR21_04685 [Rhodobacteraceae bacterium]|nr:hypothetical protein [Paracoccaceae bacterium]